MSDWNVVSIKHANTTAGRDTVRAASVEIERGRERREMLVELSSSANRVGRGLNVLHDVRPYLDAADPPRRVILTPDGSHPAE